MVNDKKVRILVIDDHPSMSFGTRLILEQVEHVEVVDVVYTGGEGISFVEQNRPDIVLLDLALPDLCGPEVARRIKPFCEHVVIFSGEDNIEPILNDLLSAGVSGIIHKRVSPRQVQRAIECILDGETVIPISLLAQLRVVIEEREPEVQLRDKELQLMRMVADGYTNLEIAKVLFVSPKTVENHLTQIYRKLSVQSRIEAVQKVKVLGLL